MPRTAADQQVATWLATSQLQLLEAVWVQYAQPAHPAPTGSIGSQIGNETSTTPQVTPTGTHEWSYRLTRRGQMLVAVMLQQYFTVRRQRSARRHIRTLRPIKRVAKRS